MRYSIATNRGRLLKRCGNVSKDGFPEKAKAVTVDGEILTRNQGPKLFIKPIVVNKVDR